MSESYELEGKKINIKEIDVNGIKYKTTPFIFLERKRIMINQIDGLTYFNESFRIVFEKLPYMHGFDPISEYVLTFQDLIQLLDKLIYIDLLELNKAQSHSYEELASDDAKHFKQIIETCNYIKTLNLFSRHWSKDEGEFFVSSSNIKNMISQSYIGGMTNLEPSGKLVHVPYVYK